jgi:iron complex outermembrane receptor protein
MFLLSVLLPASLGQAWAGADADSATALPRIDVIETTRDALAIELDAMTAPVAGPSTGELLRRAPGGALNNNGPLSGTAQYRGMFGDRVAVKVNGLPIASGGPGGMDPPLHYAPIPLLDAVVLRRGIAPVSDGPESMGGHVDAHLLTSQFTDGPEFAFQGRLNASAQTVNDGIGAGLLAGVANDRKRAHVLAAYENGDDSRFDGGRVQPTEYQRSAYGLGAGTRSGDQAWSVDYLRNQTRSAGTPALPMDILFFDSDFLRVGHSGQWGRLMLESKVYATEVDHEMTNFHLRQPPPDPTLFRNSLADSEAFGFSADARMALAAGLLRWGIDGHRSLHNTRVRNPNAPAFFVDSFNDVRRQRHGLFGEWRRSLASDWQYETGLRFTQVRYDAGLVDGLPAQAAPGGPRVLRERFNNADRSAVENNIDAVASLAHQFSERLRLDIGLGRKTRAPSYQERYLWIPLEATGGLADRRNYIGDLNLDSEVSHQIEAGADWQSQRLRIAPRLFYRRVDDYIQGVPVVDPVAIAVSTANGDPTPLRFANVDAELYGFDSDFSWALAERWRLHGVISYVRGKRRDIDDNLYRIAPLNGHIALTHARDAWTATLETAASARQSKVSATNFETASAGYGIVNLYGTARLASGVQLMAGVNNLFDNDYSDHLNGYNRVRGADVPFGDRLPGLGRNGFVRVAFEW